MLPVSKEFHAAMVADNRRTFGRVTIDYTGPFVDQNITASANEQANAAVLLPQVADNLATVPRRWASADGTTLADGLSFPAPSVPTDGQMGWWGEQMAGVGGAFSGPFPTLTVNFASRPVHSLRVVGDSARGEFPVDFEIRLLGIGGIVRHTHTVTGNTLMDWQVTITPVTEVTQYVLEVRRWSHAGRQAKIVEVFTSIQETYEGDNLISIGLLEEREIAQQGLPVGIISANEITVRLDNSTRKFDAGNRESPLYQLLRQNRRIRAWLGMKGDGSGVNMQQAVDFNQGVRRNLIVNAGRLELPVVGAAAFARNSTAYRQDGTLVNTNLPRFETGRFGQAVMIEEGTTNLISPPRSPRFSSASAPPTIQWDIANNFRISGTDAIDAMLAFVVQPTNLASADITAFTLRIENPVNTSRWVIQLIDVNGAAITSGWSAPGWTYNTWYVGWLNTGMEGITERTLIGLPAGVRGIGFGVRSSVLDGGQVCSVDRLQIEARSYATSFIDGTRAAETLTIPTAGVLSFDEGTIEVTFTPTAGFLSGQPWARIIGHNSNAVNRDEIQLMRRDSTSQLAFAISNNAGQTQTVWDNVRSSTNLQAGVTYRLAIRWSFAQGLYALFVNGVKESERALTEAHKPSVFGTLAVGYHPHHISRHCNSLIDDLRISNRARTDAEIAAAFASGQPLPVDASTTYLMRMDGDINHGQGGDYTSPEYDLSTVGTAITSGITWQAPADGVARDVSARLDGQAWTPVTNGGALPFSPGQLLTGRRLQLHALMRRG